MQSSGLDGADHGSRLHRDLQALFPVLSQVFQCFSRFPSCMDPLSILLPFVFSPNTLFPDKFKEPAVKTPAKRRRTVDSSEEEEESEEEESSEDEALPPKRYLTLVIDYFLCGLPPVS